MRRDADRLHADACRNPRLVNTEWSERVLDTRIQRHATGLVRTLVVASATLAILLVCFSIYQASQNDPEAAVSSRTPRLPSTPTEPVGYSDESDALDAPGVALGQGIIGPGQKIQITLYPREGKRARLEIAVRDWTPLGGSSNEFLLSEPEARMRTKDGHAVRVTADRGILQAQRKSGSGLDPQRGTLTGNVVILYDRLSELERAELPEELRDRIDPSDLVRIELDEIEFDLEYSKLIVPGHLHLSARDVEFDATDLEIRFNDAENRVESMRISRGGRLELHEQGKPQGSSISGVGTGDSPQLTLVDWLRASIRAGLTPKPQKQTEKPSDQPPDVAFSEEGVPVFRSDAQEGKKPKPPIRYYARFEGNVDARRLLADVVSARIQADVLEMIRDVSDKDQARARAPQMPEPPQDEKGPTPTSERIVLEWSDRLLVQACTSDDDRCASETRSRITATGSPTRLHHPQGDATCAKLTFDPDGSKVWLYGTPADPVVVRSADQGVMTGVTVFSERHGDDMYIHVTGPGTLVRDVGGSPSQASAAESDEARPALIEFADKLEVHGRFVSGFPKIDFATGQVSSRQRRVLDRAEFVGKVRFHQAEMNLDADALTLTFGRKRGLRDSSGIIERVVAQGHVVMTQGADRVTCREIDVALTVAPDGRTLPKTATALGDVVAENGGTVIQARDKLVVDFETVARVPSPAKGTLAGAPDVEPHPDVAAPDTDAHPAEHQAKKRYESVAKRLRAWGEVIVSDPAQALNLSAEKLDCSIANGRDIETAIVEGLEDQPASVRLDTFTVIGRQIILSVPDEHAEVPGAGRLTFHSRKDLDGRKVAEPIPIAITWNDRLEYRGSENRAVFSGNVHAASEMTTTFDCDRLLVEFDDVTYTADESTAPSPRGRPQAPEPTVSDWWIFQEIVARLLPASGERKRVRVTSRFSKEPAYILATGNAVALTSEIDPVSGLIKSRARISGPMLSLNLRPDVSKMVIEGAGNLLLEDNRPARPRDLLADRGPGGLFDVNRDAGPSKTLIEWDDLMWYDFAIDQTQFEGNVSLKHFSGDELMRIRGLSVGGSAEVPAGRATFLTCDALTLDFLDRDERARRPAGRRMGRLSADRLKRFHAKGSVVLQDESEGLSLTADRLIYWKDRELLGIYGSPRRRAHIVTRKPGQLPNQVSVERLFYSLATRKLEVSKPGLNTR